MHRLTVLTVSGVVIPLLIILVPWYPLQLVLGLGLIAFLPGYAFIQALRPFFLFDQHLPAGLIAVPFSISLTIIALLGITAAHLPLTNVTVAVVLGGITLVCTFAARRQKTSPTTSSTTHRPAQAGWLLVILFLAMIFRMVNIHYSDLQGDEADILLRAVRLTYGQTEAILTHSKGPGEILLINAIAALTARFDEQTVRLPFALAGAAGIGLIYLFGSELLGTKAGRIAGLLAALDGVFISYARTAQYQSVVLLLTISALYLFYHFSRQKIFICRIHTTASLLLATAFLFHFETLLLLPVAGYLTVRPIPWPGFRQLPAYLARLKPLRSLWVSVVIFAGIVGAFYIPFLLHPNVGKTGAYLENRIGGGDFPPFNNLAHFFYFEALKYNAIYYVIVLTLGLMAALLLSLRSATGESRWKTTTIAAGWAILGIVLLIAGQEKLSALVYAVGFGLAFALIILSPQTPLPLRLLWLWIAPPFWTYIFLVNRPGKHHYLFLGGLIILIGSVVDQGWQTLSARWTQLRHHQTKLPIAIAGITLLAVIAGHSIMLFLRSDLEYILTYPTHKSVIYPTDSSFPYKTRIGFGYPFRLGWQVVGQLRRTGKLIGDWAGNDAGNAPTWYMLGQEPTPCYPHYVLHGEITYKGDDDFDVPFDPAQFGYQPRYRIWGNNRLRMTILEFDPLNTVTESENLYETSHFDPPPTAADFADAFLSLSRQPPQVMLNPAPVLGEGSEIKLNAPPEYLERAQMLNGQVALLGYDIDLRYAKPGSIVPITLHWQAQNLLNLRYKVFVHLVTPDGQRISQADDYPVCGTSHANTWQPGQVVLDRHLLKLPPDTLPGEYTLIVGMYEPELNLRLNYFDIAGNEQGNSLTAGVITVRGDE